MKRHTCVWIRWKGKDREIYVTQNHEIRPTLKSWFSGTLLHGEEDDIERVPRGSPLEINERFRSEIITTVRMTKFLRQSDAAILGGQENIKDIKRNCWTRSFDPLKPSLGFRSVNKPVSYDV